MPHPGDIHHCDKCGSKGTGKTADAEGICPHRRSCEGSRALPHALWFYRKTENCICCKIVQDLADRKALQQRKRDEKEAKKLRDGAWFKMTMGRNPKKIKTRR
jgi:hypothetical protein